MHKCLRDAHCGLSVLWICQLKGAFRVCKALNALPSYKRHNSYKMISYVPGANLFSLLINLFMRLSLQNHRAAIQETRVLETQLVFFISSYEK